MEWRVKLSEALRIVREKRGKIAIDDELPAVVMPGLYPAFDPLFTVGPFVYVTLPCRIDEIRDAQSGEHATITLNAGLSSVSRTVQITKQDVERMEIRELAAYIDPSFR